MQKNPQVVVYSKDNCPQCQTVKNVLSMNSIEFKELKLGIDYTQEELVQKSVGRSMPQIEIDDKVIGGIEDLKIWLMSRV